MPGSTDSSKGCGCSKPLNLSRPPPLLPLRLAYQDLRKLPEYLFWAQSSRGETPLLSADAPASNRRRDSEMSITIASLFVSLGAGGRPPAKKTTPRRGRIHGRCARKKVSHRSRISA